MNEGIHLCCFLFLYLGDFAVHLFAVLIINVCDDPRDGGPHFLDGAHVSAVGRARRSPEGRGLALALQDKSAERVSTGQY